MSEDAQDFTDIALGVVAVVAYLLWLGKGKR